MENARRIEIYDTTLRDGTQGEGFNLSLQDKLLIAQKLDELGVDFIEGGPNRDTMSSLLAGRADIYVGAPESVLFVVNSRTGTELKMIGAVFKKTPVGWIGIDHSIPSNQHSTRQIGVDDLRGRKIGIQAGGEYQVQIAEYALGLPPGNLKIMAAGATPDALLGGAVDYYEGFSENQPRVLEKEGVMNWTFFSLESIGYHDYFCASTVTADFYHQQSHLLACYTYALNQALQYEIQHPEEAADITMRHTTNYPQTREATLWRIQRDIKIFQGDGTEPLLAMNPAVVQKQMVWLYRFHQIELPTAPLAPATP